jgi:hypothetical protein
MSAAKENHPTRLPVLKPKASFSDKLGGFVINNKHNLRLINNVTTKCTCLL